MVFASRESQEQYISIEPVHFLDLPLDVRHRIYDFFTGEALQLARKELGERCLNDAWLVNIFEGDFRELRTARSSLLLVNKQLRSEFLRFRWKGSELWVNELNLRRGDGQPAIRPRRLDDGHRRRKYLPHVNWLPLLGRAGRECEQHGGMWPLPDLYPDPLAEVSTDLEEDFLEIAREDTLESIRILKYHHSVNWNPKFRGVQENFAQMREISSVLRRWPVLLDSLQEIILYQDVNFLTVSRKIFPFKAVEDWETALWDLATHKPLQWDAVRRFFHSRSYRQRLLKDWQAVREVEIQTDGMGEYSGTTYWISRATLRFRRNWQIVPPAIVAGQNHLLIIDNTEVNRQSANACLRQPRPWTPLGFPFAGTFLSYPCRRPRPWPSAWRSMEGDHTLDQA
jgi:hypothetical protein